MANITRQYAAAATQASRVVEKAADRWTDGVRKVTARVPAPPQVDLVPAAERYFDLVQRAVEMNRRLSLRWLQAASALSGAVREQADTAARARARYEGMTKAGLTDLLAKRDLPKTGNVDELIERLVEADGK